MALSGTPSAKKSLSLGQNKTCESVSLKYFAISSLYSNPKPVAFFFFAYYFDLIFRTVITRIFISLIKPNEELSSPK